jgi:ribosome-binding protein aMBF1 (putative translation factor)
MVQKVKFILTFATRLIVTRKNTRSMSKMRQGVSTILVMGKPISHQHILRKFGKKLQKVRKSKGISQEELAARLSMHRTYIGMVERGERNPTIRTLYKVAKALKVESSELLPF